MEINQAAAESGTREVFRSLGRGLRQAVGYLRFGILSFPKLFLTLIILLVTRASVLDYHPLPSGSMHPGLLEGDLLLVDRLAYDIKVPFVGYTIWCVAPPQRGDIVVFDSPKDGRLLVKRIIGLPGDRVELKDKVLRLNGEAASYRDLGASMDYIPVGARWSSHDYEETIAGTRQLIRRLDEISGTDLGQVTVPRDQYLLLGDNRDNSADFRFFGFVPRDLIHGRVARIAWSTGSQITPAFGEDRFWRAP